MLGKNTVMQNLVLPIQNYAHMENTVFFVILVQYVLYCIQNCIVVLGSTKQFLAVISLVIFHGTLKYQPNRRYTV